MEVVAGTTVTLNCTIDSSAPNCVDLHGTDYSWSSTRGANLCNNSMVYSCEWNNLSYVSLTISNVMEEETFSVYVQTDCGVAKSPAIKLQIIQHNITKTGQYSFLHLKSYSKFINKCLCASVLSISIN